MRWTFLGIAIVAGLLNPFLAGMNASLSRSLQQPIWSVAAVFALALAVTVAAALASGEAFPAAGGIAAAAWWSWLGGLFAASYVLSMTLAADRLGASVFTGITVTVAIVTSIVLDHYGVVGFAEHRATFARIVGGAVMTGGLVLILRS